MDEKLSITDFGRQLIETQDLDPVYTIVWEAQLPKDKLYKWLLAYWSFYHVGTASYLADQRDYWGAMAAGAASSVQLRSSERRHFRGQAAINAIAHMVSLKKTPQKIIEGFCSHEAISPSLEVMNNVKKLKGFGDWIAFKVADMLERLNLVNIQFLPEDVFNIFKSPRDGAYLLKQQPEYINKLVSVDIPLWAYQTVMEKLWQMKAPPRYERMINIQEVETILCKWKSYMNGHYHLGEDITAIRQGLLRYSRSSTSQHLLKAGKGKLWS